MAPSWKEDTRPPRHGWAAGKYLATCYKCKDTFIGDKRAMTCADCAYAQPDVLVLSRPIETREGDIVGELRAACWHTGGVAPVALARDAADEIERLRDALHWATLNQSATDGGPNHMDKVRAAS